MKWWERWILIGALFAFYVPAFSRFVPESYGNDARWAMLLPAALVALRNLRRTGSPKLMPVLVAVNAFGLWAFLTYNWSQNDYLTVTKAGVFLAVANTFVIAGAALASDDRGRPFAALAPIFLMGVGTGVLGLGPQAEESYTAGAELYQGYVSGPNMLASMLAFSCAWLIWEMYRIERRGLRRTLLVLCAVAASVLVLLSRSRASMLMIFCLLALVQIVGLRSVRALTVAYFAGGALVGALLFATEFYSDLGNFLESRIYDQYVLKWGEGGVLATRQDVFAESWDNAQEGGFFGLGYGISNQQSGGWKGQRTTISSTVNFGREKGNSQLAVIEELGWVGLALYVVVLATVIGAIASAWPRIVRDNDLRFQYGIVLGFIAGAIGHSVFEAWFTAPGSPESPAFWMMLGIAVGGLPKPLPERVAPRVEALSFR